MRAVVVVLALLAGIKIWTQDQLFRSAAEAALVNAYRDRAVQACQRDAGRAGAGTWSRPRTVRLQIGRPDVGVNIWDTDNALWDLRYRHPYIVLTSPEGAPAAECTFDVTLGSASIRRG